MPILVYHLWDQVSDSSPLCHQETEEEDSESSESGESSTAVPSTLTPVIVTDAPMAETTPQPIDPTIVTDTETGRGDSYGGYPSDYKSIDYVEEKTYYKVPVPYKSYELVGTGKKMAYDMTDGNEVEKSLQVYKVKDSLSFLRMLRPSNSRVCWCQQLPMSNCPLQFQKCYLLPCTTQHQHTWVGFTKCPTNAKYS